MTSKKKVALPSPGSRSRSSSRRRMFKRGLKVASVVPFLPSRWSQPLVQAVVLPAHAQTSCPGATIQARTFLCSEYSSPLVALKTALYTFSLVGGCLVVSVDTSLSYDEVVSYSFDGSEIIVLFTAGCDPLCNVSITIYAKDFTYGGYVDCGSSTAGLSTIPQTIPMQIGAAKYEAMFSLTGDVTRLGYTDFVVTPV